jgi:hypothetical protein
LLVIISCGEKIKQTLLYCIGTSPPFNSPSPQAERGLGGEVKRGRGEKKRKRGLHPSSQATTLLGITKVISLSRLPFVKGDREGFYTAPLLYAPIIFYYLLQDVKFPRLLN